MWIAGLVALVAASVALLVWHLQTKSVKRMTLTETLTCGELGELAKAAADVVGGGSFSQRCEVVGVAAAGEQGLLKAPESGRDVVWHRTLVTEHYWDWEKDSDGDRRRVDKTRTLTDAVSEQPFVVQDETGTIVVEPGRADVDNPPKILTRLDSGGSNGVELGSGMLANLAEGVLSQNDRTTGVEHAEWGIAAGQRLYVLAEASDRSGRLAMARPEEGGGFTISTRTEDELKAMARTYSVVALGVAALFGTAGIVLLILDLLL